LPWDIADVADSTEKVYQPVNATANDSCMKELLDTFVLSEEPTLA